MTEKYIEARNKCINNPTAALTREVLKSLLKHHKKDNDPKVSDKIGDLREAWNARKYRLDEDLVPAMATTPTTRNVPDHASTNPDGNIFDGCLDYASDSFN